MIDDSRTGKPFLSCLWWTVHLAWADGDTGTDAILAGTRTEAEERAGDNWPGAAVTVVGPEA